MTEVTYSIRGCQVDASTGGLVIEYVAVPTDIRSNGLVLNHALLIPPEDEFIELLDNVEMTLQQALREALEAFELADAFQLGEQELPTAGPYDNPEDGRP